MNRFRKKKIVETYLAYDDDDISTERLLAMVCDTCHCEVGEIIDALEEEGMLSDGNNT